MFERKGRKKAGSRKILLGQTHVEATHSDFILDPRSERAWLNLFEPKIENDPWLSLEEQLLDKNQRDANLERRWKYFGK